MPASVSLYIQGIEVTQAIQYYHSDMHLGDAATRAQDNAARLVADKAAWVRVYVRSGTQEVIHNVTGTLKVENLIPGVLQAELAPQPPGTTSAIPEPDPANTSTPFIAPQAIYRWERSQLAATLNFVIPSDLVCGQLRLTARVTTASGLAYEMTMFANANLRQQIRFRGIMVGYRGRDPSGTGRAEVDPPNLADLQAISALTLLIYPVSYQASYENAGTVIITDPIGPNGCDGDLGWDRMMKSLNRYAKMVDGLKPGCIYYGLIAGTTPGISSNIPTGGGGCNLQKVAAGFAGQPHVDRVMAHEIGHFFHPHAPCGLPQNDSNDPNYPDYKPYDPASIGEYGLDINNGAVKSPETYKDIMSYCPPNVWISLYGHKLCTNHPLLNPTIVCDPTFSKPPLYHDPKYYIPDPTYPFVPAQARSYIYLGGMQDALGEITIEDVYRAETFAKPDGAPTGLVVVLSDDDDQVLASAPLLRIRGAPYGDQDCGCADREAQPPFFLEAMLPDVAPGAALCVLRDGAEIWRRDAPPVPPQVSAVSVEVLEGNRLAVSWRAESHPGTPMEYWVRWSADEGKTWNALSTGFQESAAQFSLEGLPAGEMQIQVVIHDGFYSIASEPVAVAVPPQRPIITILHPAEGDLIPASGTLRLWAVASNFGPEFEVDDFHWFLNGREVGRGLEAWTVAPIAGLQRCTLRLESDNYRINLTTHFNTV